MALANIVKGYEEIKKFGKLTKISKVFNGPFQHFLKFKLCFRSICLSCWSSLVELAKGSCLDIRQNYILNIQWQGNLYTGEISIPHVQSSINNGIGCFENSLLFVLFCL